MSACAFSSSTARDRIHPLEEKVKSSDSSFDIIDLDGEDFSCSLDLNDGVGGLFGAGLEYVY